MNCKKKNNVFLSSILQKEFSDMSSSSDPLKLGYAGNKGAVIKVNWKILSLQ
jgi:hypothetical protein